MELAIPNRTAPTEPDGTEPEATEGNSNPCESAELVEPNRKNRPTRTGIGTGK